MFQPKNDGFLLEHDHPFPDVCADPPFTCTPPDVQYSKLIISAIIIICIPYLAPSGRGTAAVGASKYVQYFRLMIFRQLLP